jgi:2,3-dihydroxyphenylpropionate 1,2-dioxygenase
MRARSERADPAVRDPFFATLDRMRRTIEEARPDAIMVIAAEHFANFFMNNMPAYCIGMGEEYEGPIEDPEWLRIPRGGSSEKSWRGWMSLMPRSGSSITGLWSR